MADFITKITRFFLVTIWQQLPEQTHAIWRWIINGLRISYIVIRELAKGELNLRAMSLVFTTLLSLVPLIAVVFSVLKAFGVHNQLEPFLLSMLEPLGEQGPEITSNIIGFVQNVKVGVLGTLGVTILLYTIIALVQKVENAFNFVWRITRSRTLARRFTDYLSVMMIGPLLVVTALGLAAAVMNHDVVQSIQAIEPIGTLILVAGKLVPYVMIILAFTFFYMFIPNTRVELMSAFIGAVFAGVLWISIGKVFAAFVVLSSNYTAIYSSFAILFLFMIWLYLAWFILLTGSQLAFYLQYPKLVQFDGSHYELSPRLREQAGIWLMTVIAKQFYQQQPALNIEQLEQQTCLAGATLEELVMTLQQGGLIVELTGDESRYQPAQDIANIQVSTILKCLRTAKESEAMYVKSMVNAPVEQLLQRLEQTQQTILADLNLRDLVLGKIDNG